MGDPPQRPSGQPPSGGPPRLERAAAPGSAPKASYGLADPTVPASAALAAGLTIEGDLAGEGPLRLFYLAVAMQASGRLVLGVPGQKFALSFKKGVVEHVLAEAPELGLGRFLVQKGSLKSDELAKAEAAQPQAGGELVGALIALRLVNPAEVAPLLQEHGAGLVTRALATEQGRFRWDPGMAPPPSAFPLGNSWSFLSAAVRSLDAAAVAKRLGARMGQVASRTGGRIRLEDLRLTPQEARAAQLFDGARTPQELAAAAAADTVMILRLALLMGEAELLSFGASRATAAPPPAAPAATAPVASPVPVAATPATTPGAVAAKPAPVPIPVKPPPAPARPAPTVAQKLAAAAVKPAPAPAPPAAAAPPLNAANLKLVAEKMKAADLFEVLGVKPDATGAQIKIAYFQLAKHYHPDAVPSDALPDVRSAAADVFARVGEAWSVLGDDAKRAQYIDDLKSGAGTEVDVMHIFRAEEAFNSGTLLVKARRYQEALAKLDEAIKLNAEEAEFHIWRGWCDFLLSAEKKKAHTGAASAIEAALRKNPRCISGYLFLGQMAKIVGDLALAERQLKRGLKEAPGNTDIERELKYLRK